MKSNFWQRGEQTQLAKVAGLSPKYLGDILHRRRGVSRKMAERLAEATVKFYGYPCITRLDWMCNDTTHHEAFYGEPKIWS